MLKLPRLPVLKPRERLLAGTSGLVLLMVVMDRFVLNPWMRHAQAVRQSIHQMEGALQTHNRLLTRKDRVVAEHARYRSLLSAPLADDLQTAALVKELEGLAGESHILLGEIKPLPLESTAESKRYTLDIRFECTLEEWAQFVYGIERSPSLFEVVRAGLATREDKRDRLQGSLRVASASLRSKDVLEGGNDAAPAQ